jgi:hypothetical protein
LFSELSVRTQRQELKDVVGKYGVVFINCKLRRFKAFLFGTVKSEAKSELPRMSFGFNCRVSNVWVNPFYKSVILVTSTFHHQHIV